jgi:hypothetical protein
VPDDTPALLVPPTLSPQVAHCSHVGIFTADSSKTSKTGIHPIDSHAPWYVGLATARLAGMPGHATQDVFRTPRLMRRTEHNLTIPAHHRPP